MPSNPASSKFLAIGSIMPVSHILRPQALMAVADRGVDESRLVSIKLLLQ